MRIHPRMSSLKTDGIILSKVIIDNALLLLFSKPLQKLYPSTILLPNANLCPEWETNLSNCLIPQKKWGPSASPLDPFTSGGAPPGGAPALAGGSPPGGPWKRVGGGNLMGSVEKFYTPK